MAKRDRYRDHIDPEHQRWGRTYHRFPGVAECVRLIQDGKARGTWTDIIVHELGENAAGCLPELIEVFGSNADESVRLYIMMALDLAWLPESVPFLEQVLREGNPAFTPYAMSARKHIDTKEARTVLWQMAKKAADHSR